MDTDLARFLESLTEPQASQETRDAEWRALIESLSRQPVPTGRLARLWTMGSLPTRVAVGYALNWLKERFATDEEREALRERTHLRSAARLLAGMGYLRGAALKVGQTIAQYPDVLPEQYTEMLSALQSEAPPMHFSLLREHFRSELGDDPESVFGDFEPEAFAAASLGQVHRAQLRSGEQVAVKIQYPNIARAIQDDLSTAKVLLRGMPFLHEWRNSLDLLEEIRVTLTAETDYRRELANARRVRAALAPFASFVVPQVFPQYSSARVLTMEYLAGQHPGEFLAGGPTQEERDRLAAQILRANYHLWCNHRLVHADPNPGNYLALEGGRLGLLDFGCVREFTDGEWAIMQTSIEAIRGDEAARREAIRAFALLEDSELSDPQRYELYREFSEWMWRPLTTEHDFDFSDGSYLQRGFDLLAQLLKKRYTRTLPVGLWLDRQICGLRGLFTLLRSRVPYRRIHEEEVARAGL